MLDVWISDLTVKHELDCLFLTETRLGADAPATLIEACPANFTFSHSCREGRKGRGPSAICSETLKHREVDTGAFSAFQYNAISFKCQPPLFALIIYTPPPRTLSTFLIKFSEFSSVRASVVSQVLWQESFSCTKVQDKSFWWGSS